MSDNGIQRRIKRTKLSEEVVMISDSAVYSRLKHLKNPVFPVDSRIPTALKEKTVTRPKISAKFGGNAHTLVHRPSDSRVDQHGYTHFLCPILSSDPHAPQFPGAHGLLLRSGSGEFDELFLENSARRHKVIVGLARNSWMYMGEYEMTKSKPLSIAEWMDVPRAVSMPCSIKIMKALNNKF